MSQVNPSGQEFVKWFNKAGSRGLSQVRNETCTNQKTQRTWVTILDGCHLLELCCWWSYWEKDSQFALTNKKRKEADSVTRPDNEARNKTQRARKTSVTETSSTVDVMLEHDGLHTFMNLPFTTSFMTSWLFLLYALDAMQCLRHTGSKRHNISIFLLNISSIWFAGQDFPQQKNVNSLWRRGWGSFLISRLRTKSITFTCSIYQKGIFLLWTFLLFLIEKIILTLLKVLRTSVCSPFLKYS